MGASDSLSLSLSLEHKSSKLCSLTAYEVAVFGEWNGSMAKFTWSSQITLRPRRSVPEIRRAFFLAASREDCASDLLPIPVIASLGVRRMYGSVVYILKGMPRTRLESRCSTKRDV